MYAAPPVEALEEDEEEEDPSAGKSSTGVTVAVTVTVTVSGATTCESRITGGDGTVLNAVESRDDDDKNEFLGADEPNDEEDALLEDDEEEEEEKEDDVTDSVPGLKKRFGLDEVEVEDEDERNGIEEEVIIK